MPPLTLLLYLAGGLLPLIAILIIGGRWFFQDGLIQNNPDMTHAGDIKGHYAIVTGANKGVGKEVTKSLVQLGCNVILACRSETRAQKAIDDIKKELSHTITKSQSKCGTMTFIKVDLSDFSSVDSFVSNFKSQFNKLHILINNAACVTPEKMRFTNDGFEWNWQINYLSHFYLTEKLIPMIENTILNMKNDNNSNNNSCIGRIINVTSKGHMHASKIPYIYLTRVSKKDIDKIDSKLYKYEKMNTYHDTKAAQVLHSFELQKRLDLGLLESHGEKKQEKQKEKKENKRNIFVASVHPGLVNTEIFGWDNRLFFERMFIKLIWPIFLMIAKTPLESSKQIIHCVLGDVNNDKLLKAGGYHSNCKSMQIGYGYKEFKHMLKNDGKKLYDDSLKIFKLCQ